MAAPAAEKQSTPDSLGAHLDQHMVVSAGVKQPSQSWIHSWEIGHHQPGEVLQQGPIWQPCRRLLGRAVDTPHPRVMSQDRTDASSSSTAIQEQDFIETLWLKKSMVGQLFDQGLEPRIVVRRRFGEARAGQGDPSRERAGELVDAPPASGEFQLHPRRGRA